MNSIWHLSRAALAQYAPELLMFVQAVADHLVQADPRFVITLEDRELGFGLEASRDGIRIELFAFLKDAWGIGAARMGTKGNWHVSITFDGELPIIQYAPESFTSQAWVDYDSPQLGMRLQDLRRASELFAHVILRAVNERAKHKAEIEHKAQEGEEGNEDEEDEEDLEDEED